MDLHELQKAVRRGWWLILVVTAICTEAAIVYTQRSEPRYESYTQLFVAAQVRDFSVQRAPSYASLVASPNVTEPVIRELRLPDTTARLARRLSASAPPNTVLINLVVDDSDPVRAQRTGSAVANQLIKLVAKLERPSSTGRPQVSLSVSSPASLPSDPVSPNKQVNIAAGIVLGLLFGVLAAIVRRRVDRRITTADDLPDAGHGVLAAVPVDGAARTIAGARLSAASPERAEALRRLRTSLRFIGGDEPPRTIVVSSVLPGDGASTTAVGLATALADAGADVVLVEADLRRPMLAGLLGLRPGPGLAGHLAGEVPIEQLLHPWGGGAGAALRVLAAGPVPPNPSELLSSQRMRRLLADLRTRCDIVIVDAPPVLSVTDAAVLSGEADGVLLVVRMGRVTRPALERALVTFAHARANVLGFVAVGMSAAASRDLRRDYPARPAHAAEPPASGPPHELGPARPRAIPAPAPAGGETPPAPSATSRSR